MRVARLALLAAALAAPAAASAGDLYFTPYIWIPGVDGTIGTPNDQGGLGERLSFDFNKFADSLRLGGAMLNLTWRQDRLVVFGDWTYANVRSEAPTLVGLVYPTVKGQIKGSIAQLYQGYTILEEGKATLDLFMGARAYDLYAGLTFTGGAVPDVKSDGSSFWLDAVGGVRLDSRLGEKWLLHVRGDIGAGGSNFSWQAFGVGGYEFSWGALVLGYRHLYIDKGQGSAQLKLALSGPFFGANFKL